MMPLSAPAAACTLIAKTPLRSQANIRSRRTPRCKNPAATPLFLHLVLLHLVLVSHVVLFHLVGLHGVLLVHLLALHAVLLHVFGEGRRGCETGRNRDSDCEQNTLLHYM